MIRMKRFMLFAAAVIMMVLVPIFASGCAGTSSIDTTGMYLVVYEGNGGYLGNKATTVRKLYCQPGSKIPDYPTEYTTNQYTVSSLGLAQKNGYQLMGWYANADYSLNKNGKYILLSADSGNGVYESSLAGEYVRKYIEAPEGGFIFVYAQESAAQEDDEPDKYILLVADPEAPEEERISVESGFYVCNGESTISEIDDGILRAAYTAAYENGTYTAQQVAAMSGWLLYEDLTDEQKELFSGFTRYEYTFGKATEADEGIDHYDLVTGYAYIYDVFTEDEDGDFIFDGENYVKTSESAADDQQRFSVNDVYVFTGDTTVGMDRYNASMQYWDFANQHVTEEDCTWDGEKFVLTLYAHWEKKNTVFFHYNNGTDQVDEITRRLLKDNRTYVNLTGGDIIGKKEAVPVKAGFTFIGWSKSETEFDMWDFENDVFPESASELHLYAFYIEGSYTRIDAGNGVNSLRAIGNDPAGKYVLTGNFDFGGSTLSASPFGLKAGDVFTGEIISVGARIHNFVYSLETSKQQTLSADEVETASLIPAADGASVSGLDIGFEVKVRGAKATAIGNTDVSFVISGLIGNAQGAVTVSDCSINVRAASANSSTLASESRTYVFRIGDIAAVGSNRVSGSGNTSVIDTEGLVGSVKTQITQLGESGTDTPDLPAEEG